MASQIILSCPFCHHRADYHDAPPGSTVRCHECGSIFRVPALGQRKPGTVVKGEEIRGGGGKKWVVTILLLLIVCGACLFAWQKWSGSEEVVGDRFADVEGIFPEDSAYGTLQRFLESWKAGNMKWMLEYCREADQPKDDDKEFRDWLDSMFAQYKLVSYETSGVKKISAYQFVYPVAVDGIDLRTGIKVKGSMSTKMCLENIGEDKVRWGLDIRASIPRWD